MKNNNVRGMRMKKVIILMVVGLLVLLMGGVIYNRIRVELFGEKLFINNISMITIDTEEKSYIITDRLKISDITKEASKLNRLYKVESDNIDKLHTLDKQYSEMQISPKYRQLTVILKNNIHIGGRFIMDNNQLIFECNGYVWETNDKFMKMINNSTKDTESININN
jgi:hypothetical protein